MTKSQSVHVGTTSITPTLTNPGPYIILSKEDLSHILKLIHASTQHVKDTLPPRGSQIGHLYRLQQNITHLSEVCEPLKDQPSD